VKTIQLWAVERDKDTPSASPVERVDNTETEKSLEDLLVASPELLMPDLTLIGRQVPTEGGPLDLLGIDSDGRLVVFELKRGTLTREAVAQVLDYASDLAALDEARFARLIEEHSGQLGIEKFTDFADWYSQEYPGQSENFLDRPKMVLVGLGVDDRARRIVNFLADSRVDIQLLTFNAFRSADTLLLARQIESRPPKPPITSSPTKASNLKILLETATDLGVKDLLIAVDEFIEKRIQGYSWPNKMGHSYYLPERTDAGGFTSRCYVSIRLDKKERGSLFLGVWARAATAAGTVTEEFFSSRDFIKDKHGITYLRFRADDWPSLQESLSGFLAAVVEGWKGLSDEVEKDQE
jgi:hypothetical protein